MNKFFLCCLNILLSCFYLNAQIDIADARSMSLGSVVTVEGVVTNGDELGIIRYLQDDTGAIPAYPGAGSVGDLPGDVQRGDLIQVTGTLKEFHGLLEIDPIDSYTVISSGNSLPDPLTVTPNGINESNEAKLMKVEEVTFDEAGGIFSVGNYSFTENGGGESSEIYVRSGSSFIGSPIPQAAVNLTGLGSEFDGLYQLLLRDDDDLEIVDDFFISSAPSQSNLTTEGFTISWTTNVAASSNLRYGTTMDMENEITNSNSTTNHSIDIDGLDPAEFYYVQAFSDNGASTVNSIAKLFSTGSTSSGQVNIYFNNSVDASYSNGNYPSSTTGAALEAAIIHRINQATTSIDCSIYNINRVSIVEALTNAYNNGIVVRYIRDKETANLALSDPTPPFPILSGSEDGLMHNKFFIFDADSENDSWVMMGSTNMTDNNIGDDYNNTLAIQDKAIAKAYTLEFNEMWGTDGPNPGTFVVKFGENKEDNTPHLFSLNGMEVESYFSPSDNTALAITRVVESADDDLQFAMLTFTYNELGAAVVAEHNAGTTVRGIIDNINDTGGEYDFLVSNGVNVTPDNTPISTHHKYCIVDATNSASDPVVVTGSHNWSAGADVSNDENTLIFHDENIANIFLQEFEARWCEANGGGAECITAVHEFQEINGFDVSIFPHPADDQTNISMSLEQRNDITINLWDFNGRLLQSSILKDVQGEQNERLFLNGFAPGMYVVTFQVGNKMTAKQLEIVR